MLEKLILLYSFYEISRQIVTSKHFVVIFWAPGIGIKIKLLSCQTGSTCIGLPTTKFYHFSFDFTFSDIIFNLFRLVILFSFQPLWFLLLLRNISKECIFVESSVEISLWQWWLIIFILCHHVSYILHYQYVIGMGWVCLRDFKKPGIQYRC